MSDNYWVKIGKLRNKSKYTTEIILRYANSTSLKQIRETDCRIVSGRNNALRAKYLTNDPSVIKQFEDWEMNHAVKNVKDAHVRLRKYDGFNTLLETWDLMKVNPDFALFKSANIMIFRYLQIKKVI